MRRLITDIDDFGGFLTPCEEKDGPFPWGKTPTAPPAAQPETKDHIPQNDEGFELSGGHMFSLHGVEVMSHDLATPSRPPPAPVPRPTGDRSTSDDIIFDLPCCTAVAGVVLRHAYRVVDKLLEQHSPMTYKFGITHSAEWRWCNSIYGYAFSRDKWTKMLVLYQSDEPWGPSMLEAALIHRYDGNWFCTYMCLLSFLFFPENMSILPVVIPATDT